MSYILDALRRADAERERKRGAVPSLQSQQHTLVPEEDEAPRRPAVLLAGAGVLALLVVVLVAWWLLGERSAPPARVLDAAATPQPANVAAPRPMTLSEIAAAPPVLATPSPAPAVATAPTTTLPTTAAAPARSSTPRTQAAESSELARAARRSSTASTTPASTAAPRSDADARIVAQAELPDAVRRELPTLSFAGASYSGDAASRMVIINGQVFHEGDTISKGLVLQQIRLRTAVLAYRGYRYEVTY